MKKLRILYCVLMLLPLLAACETEVPARQFPEISFANEPPIKLDVASIKVENKPAPPSTKGSIVYDLPVTPSSVAQKWAEQRLKAVGRSGTAIVHIEKASLVEQKLKKTEGLRGMFTTDQTERYIGEMQISVSVSSGHGQATARAESRSSRTVAEDASLADREKLWFDMVEHLGHEVDSVLDREIHKHMAEYIR
jgi:hypothetical protein